jgi:hypothetical protein
MSSLVSLLIFIRLLLSMSSLRIFRLPFEEGLNFQGSGILIDQFFIFQSPKVDRGRTGGSDGVTYIIKPG